MNPTDIKDIRVKLGVSQEKFAQMLGVSFGTINRWERGSSKPSPLALDKIKYLLKTQYKKN